jgi:hypothetical protein
VVLLQRSTLEQAAALIRADPVYTDLTPTQYALALEWLRDVGVLQAVSTNSGSPNRSAFALRASLRRSPVSRLQQVLFERGLAHASPAWLPDADVLVPGPVDVPTDALAFASALELSDQAAFQGLQQVQGKIDLEQRSRIGAMGEHRLVELLEDRWPGSTNHVAIETDGLGYDVVFWYGSEEWHLEVKTTTRRGRLVIHLSRHEFEVGLQDPQWRLVIVGLGDDDMLTAVVTADLRSLAAQFPIDRNSSARWESARIDVRPQDLQAGLRLAAGMTPLGLRPPASVTDGAGPHLDISWLPPSMDVSLGSNEAPLAESLGE